MFNTPNYIAKRSGPAPFPIEAESKPLKTPHKINLTSERSPIRYIPTVVVSRLQAHRHHL